MLHLGPGSHDVTQRSTRRVRWILNVGFGALVVIVLSVVALDFGLLYREHRTQTRLYEQNLSNAADLADLRANLNAERLLVANMLATPRARWASWPAQLAELRAEDDRLIHEVAARFSDDATAAPIMGELVSLRRAFAEVREAQLLPLLEGGQAAEARALFEGAQRERHRRISELALTLERGERAEAEQLVAASAAQRRRHTYWFIALAAAALAAAITAAAIMNRAFVEYVSARDRAAAERRRARRALTALSATNQALVHATNETTLLADICRIVVEEAGYKLAWVGFAEQDDRKTVRPAAHAGIEAGYLENIGITWADNPRGRGPTGTAIRTGRPAVCRDMLRDPSFEPWRADALKRGYASSLVLPLQDQDRVFGALSIYAVEPDAFDVAESSLLQEMAGDLGYGLVTLRARAAQHRTQVALRESEERYRSVISAIGDGIILADASGRIVTCNPSAERILGLTVERLIGERSAGLLGPCQREDGSPLREEDHPYAQTLATGKPCRDVRIGFMGRSGSLTWLAASAEPLFRPGEPRPFAVVTSFTDITERKALEAQFLQAQKMDAFGQLAGGIAHDFNNVIAVILMQLGLLEMMPDLPPRVAGAVKELETAGQRASALTRQLLLFSRRQAMRPQTLDLNQVLVGLVKMLRRLIGEHLDFVFEPSSEPLWIEGDPGMIEQVAMNLCVNARDAMPKGGRLSIITARIDARPGGEAGAAMTACACLTVTDAGCGMDEATRRRLFEPFFTTKPVGKGTGLGLATVYGIVKQHRGWIEVDSTIGVGSTFRVFFPTARPADSAAKRGPAQAGAVEMPGGTETVLLVEDERTLRETAAHCLRQRGYQVTEAADGIEALRIWEERDHAFDLLFTDVVMPNGCSGMMLAEQLIRAKPSLGVIVMSGYSVEITGSALPANRTYLTKPFQMTTLLQTVRRVLDGKR
jgi:PAS domain S-box-containing protein